jgi:hypothetical protein
VYEVRRILFLASRWVAILACGVLTIELFRSFYATDTVGIIPFSLVTDRGSVYLASNFDVTYIYASEPIVAGVRPWPVRRVPYVPWESESVLGFNAWFEDGYFLVTLPILLLLPVPALYLVWCHRTYGDRLLRRTHYLACPTCGYELSGVMHTICPECGSAVVSRVIEAVPARRPRGQRSDAPGRAA